MKYSVDTSAILDAWQRHYPPDNFPTLWDNLERLINDGVLVSSQMVLIELKKKDDDAFAWFKQRDHFFVPVDTEIQECVTNILVDHKKLIDQRKNRSGADPFVIALAQIQGCKVLTGEKPSISLQKRPHIPDVCEALNIEWLNILNLIKEQNWVF